MKGAELREHLDSVDPGFGSMIDGLREEFPGLKVVHIQTEKVKIGTPTDPSRLVEMTYSPAVKPVMEAWYKDVENIIAGMKNKNLKRPTKTRRK